MRHISYKDLSPERYQKWVREKIKMLRRSLRNPGITETRKQEVLDRIEALKQ